MKRIALHHLGSTSCKTSISCLTQNQRNGLCCNCQPFRRPPAPIRFSSTPIHANGPGLAYLLDPGYHFHADAPGKPFDDSPMAQADGTASQTVLFLRPLGKPVPFTLIQRGIAPASSPCMNEAHIKVWLHVESMVQATAASFWSHRLEQLLSWCHIRQICTR
ncbi:hypothetical protein LZ30DRAFT_114909 [Colletotrichum cereale]|nr:hypothetical protein LZ30DRAFT_114909 [Colletotrichum cereale]